MGVDADRIVVWTHAATRSLPCVQAFERGVGAQVVVHLEDLHDPSAPAWKLTAEYADLPAWGVLDEARPCLRLGVPIARLDPDHPKYLTMVEAICMPAVDHQRFFGAPRTTWNPDTGEIFLHAVIRDHGQAPEVLGAQFDDALRETIAMLYLVLFRIWQLKRRWERGPEGAEPEIETMRARVHTLIGTAAPQVPPIEATEQGPPGQP